MNFLDCMSKELARNPNMKSLRIHLDNESSFVFGNAVKSCQQVGGLIEKRFAN